MNKIYLALLVVIICIIGIVLMNVFVRSEPTPIIKYVEIEKPIVVEKIQIVEKKVQAPTNNYDIPLFQKIATEVANSHDYDIQNFNCEDFSSELANKLTQAGYTTEVIRGTLKNCNPSDDTYNCRHAWVRIEVNIEATNGSILDPDFYEDNYKD
jgi:hypothetical protein